MQLENDKRSFTLFIHIRVCVWVCVFLVIVSASLIILIHMQICVYNRSAKVVHALTKRPSATIKLDACECRIESGAARHMPHTKPTRRTTCTECHTCQGMFALTHSLRFYICRNFHHLFRIIILYLLFLFFFLGVLSYDVSFFFGCCAALGHAGIPFLVFIY